MMIETSTLIHQLGTALQMLGAKDLVESGPYPLTHGVFALQFRIRGCKRGNKLLITLRLDDTYSIELWQVKARWCNVFQVGETLDMVHADGLHQAIESMTGLRCSL